MGRISLIKPNPEGPIYWKTFQRHVANLIIEALLLLRQQDGLVKDELELNRLLFLCLGHANRHFGLPLPAYDGRNPPHPEDKQKPSVRIIDLIFIGILWTMRRLTKVGIVH